MRSLSKYDAAALIMMLGFVVLAAVFSQATPLFEPPDEAAHFLYAHNILKQGGLPVLEDRATVFASQATQRHHPPLYYLISAALISGTDQSDAPEFLRQNPLASIGTVSLNNQNLYLHPFDPPQGGTMRAVAILRAFSVALAAGTVLLVYKGASLLFSPRIGVIAALLTASIPTFIFIGGSISNDNLTTFLFTAGIVWCARVWKNSKLTLIDAALIGVILGGIALSKVNGLVLFVVVGMVVFVGAVIRRWSWMAAVRTLVLAGGMVVMLAGWWYLRNVQLYGDLFALRATAAIWARGDSINTTPEGVIAEAQGIYYSFWMTLGHLNVTGPVWLFAWSFVLVIGGLIGSIWACIRAIRQRDANRLFALGLCGLVVIGVIAAQIVTTRQVASSQGRILFPGMIGFASLIVVGWSALPPHRVVPLLVIPVAAAALTAPLVYLPQAYRPLTAVDALPASARQIDASAEGLRLVGYELDQPSAAPGDVVEGAVYFTGSHPDDPRTILRAIDLRTGDSVGGAEFYPGTAPTSMLDPERIYRVPFRLQLDPSETPAPPVRLGLLVDWRTVENGDPAQGRYLTWDAGTFPTLNAWTRIDSTYQPDAPAVTQDVSFGGVIRLEGYTLTADGITFLWRVLDTMPEDYRLTLGSFDADGNVVAQADGEMPGFPTSAWIPGMAFEDARVLDVAPEAEAFFVGWYRAADQSRLAVEPDARGDGLWGIDLTPDPSP